MIDLLEPMAVLIEPAMILAEAFATDLLAGVLVLAYAAWLALAAAVALILGIERAVEREIL